MKHLCKYFPIRRGFSQRVVGNVKAVDDVNLYILRGETLGLVGESGCGKTTTGRCILRAIEPTSGQILFMRGEGDVVDVVGLGGKRMHELRRDMQMIFQDPYSSLNPRRTLLEIVGEPLLVNNVAKGRELEDRVADLLKRVGLRPEYMRRYPHAFSGGERQRIGIARALGTQPKLVICDEPVSALDVSVRAQTLNLLQDLQGEFQLTYLFISHDLSVVEHICDRVAVMYVGKLVEMAETEELYLQSEAPLHRGADVGGAQERPGPQERSRWCLRARSPTRQSAAGLLLPPALSLRDRSLSHGTARAARRSHQPLRQLPPCAGSCRCAAFLHRRVRWLLQDRTSQPFAGCSKIKYLT